MISEALNLFRLSSTCAVCLQFNPYTHTVMCLNCSEIKKVHDEILNTQFLDVETCSECE
jgi:formate dehydrogenase maturation protein FdhE